MILKLNLVDDGEILEVKDLKPSINKKYFPINYYSIFDLKSNQFFRFIKNEYEYFKLKSKKKMNNKILFIGVPFVEHNAVPKKLYLSLKKLELKTANVEDYYNLSHKLGISQIDNLKLQNKIFGIECNFEELNGIDFKKGCYVGQENTARIKLKNKLNKKLFAIKIIEGNTNSDEIFLENKEVGKLLIKNKNPFAIIKIRNNLLDFKNIYKCGNAKIKILRPDWL